LGSHLVTSAPGRLLPEDILSERVKMVETAKVSRPLMKEAAN
jgi:hypothetical protein